jgi:hypothetical protein
MKMANPIIKGKETMSSRERVRRTFEMEKTDRVTIGYDANDGVHARFSKALGIPDGNMEKVRQAIGVDYRGIRAPYTGPELHKVPEGRIQSALSMKMGKTCWGSLNLFHWEMIDMRSKPYMNEPLLFTRMA